MGKRTNQNSRMNDLDSDLSLPNSRVVGLTGNVASGKSTVSNLLRQRGFAVIDADQIAREVVKPGSSTLASIVNAFGISVLHPNGRLNRKKLGSLVFANDTLKAKLESITHPAIRARSQELIQEALKKTQGPVFYDAALLFESGRYKDFLHILLIIATDHIRLKRLMARDQLTNAQALKIMGAQMPQDQKKSLSNWILDNSGTLEQTELLLDELIPKILESCKLQKRGSK